MHYGPFFFTQERGAKTLRTKTKGVRIGQRERLSALDIQKGQLLYQCNEDNGEQRHSWIPYLPFIIFMVWSNYP